MSPKIDFEEVNRIIKILEEKNLAEFELEVEGFKIKIARTAPVPTAPPGPASPAPRAPEAIQPNGPSGLEPTAPVTQSGLHYVTSPMVGTFYRAPAPNAPPFIEPGEPVHKKQTLCIIEAMKLMNEIECDVDGIVKEIYVENGKPVEYGQRLFAIVPQA